MSRMFGKWNRRFMVINLKEKDFYYTPKPGGKTKKTFPLNVKTYEKLKNFNIFLENS